MNSEVCLLQGEPLGARKRPFSRVFEHSYVRAVAASVRAERALPFLEVPRDDLAGGGRSNAAGVGMTKSVCPKSFFGHLNDQSFRNLSCQLVSQKRYKIRFSFLTRQKKKTILNLSLKKM